jgi:hypothetical protein
MGHGDLRAWHVRRTKYLSSLIWPVSGAAFCAGMLTTAKCACHGYEQWPRVHCLRILPNKLLLTWSVLKRSPCQGLTARPISPPSPLRPRRERNLHLPPLTLVEDFSRMAPPILLVSSGLVNCLPRAPGGVPPGNTDDCKAKSSDPSTNHQPFPVLSTYFRQVVVVHTAEDSSSDESQLGM